MISPLLFSYRMKGHDWAESWQLGSHQSPINLCCDTLAKVVHEDDPTYIRACVNYSKVVKQCLTDPKYFTIRGLKGALTFSDGSIYFPNQYHFHAPSEHTIQDVHHDMELHIVHQSIEDPTKVCNLAIFFKRGGPDHPFINQSIQSASEPTEINLMNLFPSCELSDFYIYTGSRTLPACTENVTWCILHNPLSMSNTQLKWFTSMWGDDPSFAGGNGNVRAIQPLNDREIVYHTRRNH